ncbi:MAG TPA: hypothetical protein VIP10_09480, partial [Burkholderiaceae bacterium]
AGADGFAVVRGAGDYVSFVPTSAAAGSTSIDGRTFHYAGMEPFTPVSGDPAHIVITGSAMADTVVIEDIGTASDGMIRVTFSGLNIWNGATETQAVYDILVPAAPAPGQDPASLTIITGAGGDTITVKSLDSLFQADLLLYGSKAGTPNPEADAAQDRIVFAGNVYTRGGYLEAFADDIVVEAGVTLSVLKNPALSAGKPIFTEDEDNFIVFRARRIGTPEIENLLPSGYLQKGVSIDIGAHAKLYADSIYLVAQAEDRDIATQAGVTSVFLQQGLIDPVMDFVSGLVALPVKVLVKDAKAEVNIREHAQLLAADVIGIYANAATDSSAQAKSKLVSIGYSQADATATIDVRSYAVVEGGGAVNITSGAAATAQMATETSREEQGSVPGRSAQQSKGSAFSASLAVAYANVVSATTVHEHAFVHGGRTVNVRALGEVESAASAESGLFADGTAAIAIALQFSTAEITTTLAGKVTADMNTEGGEVVKFEFDPTVKAAVYESTDAPLTRLRTGDTVVLMNGLTEGTARPTDITVANWEARKMGAGTVLVYVGENVDQTSPLGEAANEINYRNRELWQVTTAPWGYVDYANSRISVHNVDNEANNWVVVTEDTADYSPRRGAGIGGLDAGKTYVVIELEDDPETATDESHYIRLANTERNAIEGIFVPLILGEATTNALTFGGADIQGDEITLHKIGTVFNAIELGQAVIYREPNRTDDDKVITDEDGNKTWQSPDGEIDGKPYIPLIGGADGLAKGDDHYLEHGATYYVMAAIDEFNLIGDQRLVDSQKVFLGTLENETRGGIARMKLGPVADSVTGFTLSSTHILDSTFLTFGAVSALDAEDTVAAVAGFSSEDLDDPAPQTKLQAVSEGLSSTAFDSITSLLVGKYNAQNSVGPNQQSSQAAVQIGGAFAFSYTDHKTLTLVKRTADLNSNDDMEITSNITERLNLTAESTTEPQEGRKDAAGKATEDTSADVSVSVAITVGIVNNSARAIIEGDDPLTLEVEQGPSLDSMRALRLLSGVTYPFLTRFDEFIPLSASELSDSITTDGFDAVNKYLDGFGGLTSLFNTWTRSTSSAGKLAVAGSINVLVFTNNAESIIHSGARINQDPYYRPDEGDDDFEHSPNANNDDRHVVSVEATNYMQFMNLTGVFGFRLPSLEIGVPSPSGVLDIVENVQKLRANFIGEVKESFDDYKNDQSPGSESERGGMGGAVALQFLNNTTHAIIEDGVLLYSGKDSGLNIKAEEAIVNLAFSQAGASAGKLAIAGTFSYFGQDSDTLAHLAAGSRIEGGRVDVYAGSLETGINWAGGVAKGKAVGAGIAVAVNETERDTRAVIGVLDP